MANRTILQVSFSEIQKELSSRGLPQIITESLFLASISLFSLFGNVVILLAVYRSVRLHTVTNLLVTSLALCNLLTAVVLVPISTGVLATGKMYMGRLGCKVFGSLAYLLENVTFHTVCMMALNRLVLMAKPKWYDLLFSFKSTVMTVVSSWLFQLVYAFLPAFANWSEPFLSPGYSTCAFLVTDPLAKKFYRAQREIVVVGGVAVICACYIVVYIKIKNKKRIVFPVTRAVSQDFNTMEQDQNDRNEQDNERQQPVEFPDHDAVQLLSQLKTTKVLFYITVCFLVSWIPLSIILIVESYQSKYVSRQVELFGMTLLFLGTAFIPILLTMLNRDFRFQFLTILRVKNNDIASDHAQQ